MIKRFKILFVITRGAPEVDWLLPILYVLSKRNEIYTLFTSEKSYLSVKKNSYLFNKLKIINKEFYIKKKTENLLYKFFRFLIIPFNKSLKVNRIIEKLNYKINDIKKFYKKKKVINFDYAFLEYATNSGISSNTINNQNTKIIYFPGTSYPIDFKVGNPYLKKLKFFSKYILTNVSIKKNRLPKILYKKKIFNIGNPKMEYWWIKKFKKDSIKSKNKTVLFAYSSRFDLVNSFEKIKLEKQFVMLMDILTSIKNLKIILKIHPIKNDPYYKEILKKYPKNKWKISNNHLLFLSNSCDLVISEIGSAAVLDGISCNKPTISLWSETSLLKETQREDIFKNNIKAKNTKEFEFYLQGALKDPNGIIWKKQKMKFDEFYSLKRNSSNKILKMLKYFD